MNEVLNSGIDAFSQKASELFSKINISFNSPVVLGFVIICFFALILKYATQGKSNDLLFSVYRSSLISPLTYFRFFGHAFGHSGWGHFIGNMMMILITGPLLEEKYGAANMIYIIFITALVTGIINYIFFPKTKLMGASGVVFAFILLSSFAGTYTGGVPLTFILVALMYFGQQIYEAIFVKSNVSNITHIIGGIIGSVIGYYLSTI